MHEVDMVGVATVVVMLLDMKPNTAKAVTRDTVHPVLPE
jgi:hypothetical protein